MINELWQLLTSQASLVLNLLFNEVHAPNAIPTKTAIASANTMRTSAIDNPVSNNASTAGPPNKRHDAMIAKRIGTMISSQWRGEP
jgi:hypothetical protein